MAEAHIDGVPFTHSLSGSALKEARAAIEAARKTTIVATRKLALSISIAEPATQLKVQEKLISNPDVLLTALSRRIRS